MTAPRPQSIPVFLLVRTTFQVMWQQKDDVLRLGLIPVLLCFAGFLFGQDDLLVFIQTRNAAAANAQSSTADAAVDPYAMLSPGTVGGIFVMLAVVLAAYALITVNWLRFILLGPMSAVGVGLNVSRPHWRYLVAFAGLVLIGTFVVTVATMPASLLPGIIGQIVVIAIFIGTLLAGARFIPFLVSIAISQPMRLHESWASSRGKAVSLVVALVLAWIPFMVGAFVVKGILEIVGFAQVAPAATLFIAALFQVAGWVGQAGVLATAYRHMVGIRV
jgi:hypothetical protein